MFFSRSAFSLTIDLNLKFLFPSKLKALSVLQASWKCDLMLDIWRVMDGADPRRGPKRRYIQLNWDRMFFKVWLADVNVGDGW